MFLKRASVSNKVKSDMEKALSENNVLNRWMAKYIKAIPEELSF